MKDIKELIQNYQEFMELLGEKIELQCHSNGRSRYNAFVEKGNHINIRFSENKIFVDVMDGEDSFEYEVFISEFTKNVADRELEELYIKRSEAESNLMRAKGELTVYARDKETFEKLNDIYGVAGSRYDYVNFEYHVKVLKNNIEDCKFELASIQAKIDKKII